MQFLFYTLFAVLAVVLDQVTKYLTVAFIPLGEDVPFLPGVLQLTYVQNDGAAFSSFQGRQGMFLLIFVIFTGIILYEYFKKAHGLYKVRAVVHCRNLRRRLRQHDRSAPAGLCGGHDRNGVHGVSRIQCGGLLHHLRLCAADGAPVLFQ